MRRTTCKHCGAGATWSDLKKGFGILCRGNKRTRTVDEIKSLTPCCQYCARRIAKEFLSHREQAIAKIAVLWGMRFGLWHLAAGTPQQQVEEMFEQCIREQSSTIANGFDRNDLAAICKALQFEIETGTEVTSRA